MSTIYDLDKRTELLDALLFINKVSEKKGVIEIKEKRRTRTLQQNKSIHKFCQMISEYYNEKGLTKNKKNAFTGEDVEMPVSPTMIKEDFWKPIQYSMFQIESTTELNTKQVGEIANAIERYFADKGITMLFPDKTWFMEE